MKGMKTNNFQSQLIHWQISPISYLLPKKALNKVLKTKKLLKDTNYGG